MKALKRTFYPAPEVVRALKNAPPKKLSERVNQLIMKGLSKEREEAIRAEYERYDRELARALGRKVNSEGLSTTMMMSKRLFDDDDSTEDLL